MKKVKFFLNGFLAIATIFALSECSQKSGDAPIVSKPGGTTTMKIAYVEVDTLLTKYDFWNDLNELMMKKEENIRATLNQKQKELNEEANEFQRKYQNGGFTSQERVQQEQMQLQKKAQDLQALQERLSNELASENQKNTLQLRDSINAYLKIYNKSHGYSLIISNTGFDNLLYADSAFNITKEIVAGLNKRYSRTVKK